jgi:NADH-quinone oxidoreductase subunit G
MLSRHKQLIFCSKDHTESLKAQKLANKTLIAQVAPSVRVAIGEPFGMRKVRPTQLVTSLKQLGFEYVFDTLYSADMTIMEEGTELIHRLNNGILASKTMFTSCCPGWVQLAESNYPDILDQLSTTKSPQQIMGAIVKTYFAERNNLQPEDIYMVSIMPCVKKQAEADRPHINTNCNSKDVDLVITTSELADMLKANAIDLPECQDTVFDNPFGFGTGGGVIFGRSGGVMLAALRFAYERLTGQQLIHIEFQQNPVIPSVKEVAIQIHDVELKVAIVLGLADAKKYVKAMKEGLLFHHFVEVMGCVPGGCISGGGQPPIGKNKELIDIRRDALNDFDKQSQIKAAQHNPYITNVYDEYLGEPYGDKAHDLLHTHFERREQEREPR